MVGALRSTLRFVFSLLLALALIAQSASAFAQATKPTTSAAPAAPAVAEEEAPDSPRTSMQSFLDLCDRGRYEEASRYLDLPRGAEKRGEELARKLHGVLSERLWIDVDQLSPLPRGKKDNNLPAGTEELGKIKDAKGHTVSIRIVRHEARTPEDEARWVFAQSTVQNVDALYASLKVRWLRDHLPAPLLEQGPWALYYWQWLALPLLTALCLAGGRLVTWLSGFFARRLLAKWPWSPNFLHRLRNPVTMGFGVALFWALLPYLGLTLKAEDFVGRALRALGYLAFFWALFRTVTVVGDELSKAQWAAYRPSVRSLTSVGVKLGKVFVAAIALMVAFSELGYPVTSIIAGLGIGGVALALAAQKTVENLFGSVSILADQPFVVGDTIRVDTVEGTVEGIGLRSTRLRTADRTRIILPNGKLADMRIESLGPRDRIRFATKLPISREANVVQLRAIVAEVRKRISEHTNVRTDDVFVQLASIGESSFDLDIAAMVETRDFSEFARVREDLILACIESVEKYGTRLATPVRAVLSAASRHESTDKPS
ncbi:Potassium efflux system KefA protein / Small-conductance mechanosensitive channel [Labilithrix luteola]|uniref:Potassium efflux system KefA protein / Small-conductance mechanosensitive channel n=1 Tax=Labilithrix luteola TaxID=1391654 RepID=A0A0K1PYP0_9BACT|nr:mechanosensitive ion channel family protein [Labilithrix luteola]AKU98617.1 Potassium efflux system KefA protein / Small-conductance mechanosensitive channel [Labilithrix luteola]